jgi:hypothetical protein
MKATLIVLSAAVALAVASPALAAKKHHGGGGLPQDPRIEMAQKKQTWCSLQSSCNGWDKYFEGVKTHKKYAPPSIVIGKV